MVDEARLSRPFPVVVSGPSGVGKSTIVERLLADDPSLRLAVSVTTREPRPGELEGRDYYFVDQKAFEARRDAGALVEWAEVHGRLYGTPRFELDAWLERGTDVLLDVDHQGGLAIKRTYADAVAIFVLPPSLAQLEAQLRGRRSDGEAEIQRRLEVASREMAQAVHYDYAVVNRDLDRAYEEVRAVIASERHRVLRIDTLRLEAIARPAKKA